MSEIKPEVEYVIRTGRGIVEKRQIDEPNELTQNLDTLKAQYNNLGAKVIYIYKQYLFDLLSLLN